MADSDHWDFLELIEAPMWVDLTMEAELMEKDGDNAWFCTSHPIHQMSSRQLKSSSSHANGKCLSPKASNSVSRSRGKHYKNRTWEENDQVPPLINKGNARKLDGRSLGAKLDKAASSSSSRSTVTMSSSCRKPLSNLVKKSIGKTGSVVEKTLSNSVSTNYKSFVSKPTTGGPGNIRNVKKQSCVMVCNSTVRDSKKTGNAIGKALMSKEVMPNRKSSAGNSSIGSSSTLGPIPEVVNSAGPGSICNVKKPSSRMLCNSTKGYDRKTANSTGKMKDKQVLQKRNSSTGKSSVGSSCSLGPILEAVNSCEMKSDRGKRDKSGSDSSVQVSKKHVGGRISFARCQDRPKGQRSASHELNSKDLRSLAPRKPLALLSGPRTTKELGLEEPKKINGMKNLGPSKDKATEGRTLQNSEAVERSRQNNGCVRNNAGPLQNKNNIAHGKLLKSEAMRRKTLFSSTTVKLNRNMQARNSVAAVPVISDRISNFR